MIEKYTFTLNASSSATFGKATSTRAFTGELIYVEYNPTTIPVTGGSSTYVLLRRGASSGGAILGRTSSGLAGTALKYAPRMGVILSSGLATSQLNGIIPLKNERLTCIKVGASSDGEFSKGVSLTAYIRGVS